MINMNSPTVQAMLNNLPQGVGNMPVYFGNTPTITEHAYPQQNTPYPSPKEMLMQSGESAIYTPTQFTPRNIVGGYNPGFQSAFSNYYNPYMGYGTYGGFPGMMQVPMDEDARLRQELADINGLTYDEQLVMESNMFKQMSRIVSKNLGRTEKEAEECERIYDIYNKYPAPEQIQRKPIKSIHVRIKVGDSVVADMPSTDIGISNSYSSNSMYVEQMRIKDTAIKNEIFRRNNYIYSTASERRLDDVDMLDFFNNGANALMMEDLTLLLNQQNLTRTSQVYDSDGFRQRLLSNNGIKSRTAAKAVDRFVGRYGVMPDGRPVSPGHDPAVATSFSYNPATGQYSVTAPNFIKDRLERARESFIRSIDDN